MSDIVSVASDHPGDASAVSVVVSRKEGPVAALTAHAALAGPRRPIVFGLIGMTIGFLTLSLLGAVVIFSLVLMRLAPMAFATNMLPSLTIFEVAGAVVGWHVGITLEATRHYNRLHQALDRRDAPTETTVTYGIRDEGLAVGNERVTVLAKWAAVLEVLEGPGHWLIQVDDQTLVLPKRAFSSTENEMWFVRMMLAQITPAARARSRTAEAFIVRGRGP